MQKQSSRTRHARRRTVSRASLEERPNWTVREASDWADIPLRSLYNLLREGKAPCLTTGDEQVQRLKNSRSGKRKRACFRFLIPSKAFRAWWETYNKPDKFGTAA
jgi:hypothetical protein